MKPLQRLLILLCVAHIALVRAQTLHVVLVADTENSNPEFARSCQSDFGHMQAEADTMAFFSGKPKKMYEVKGAAFTKKAILATLAGIPLKSNDILFFHYSGVAFCDADDPQRDGTRWLNLRDGALSTAEIKSAIEGKKARLNILLIDACGKYGDLAGNDRPRLRGTISNVYQSLLSASGTVEIFACRCGEFAYCDGSGGLLTNAYLSVLDSFSYDPKKNLNWKELLDVVRRKVEDLSDDKMRGQHVVFYFGEGFRDKSVP